MSEPLIPYIKLPEIPLGFLQHLPLVGDLVDPAHPPSIKPFGTLVALGVYVGAVVAVRRARARGLDGRLQGDFVFWAVAFGFIFGHIFDAIFYHPRTVLRDPLYLLRIWEGLSSYGGFAGAVIGAYFWKWYRKTKPLEYIDLTVSGMPVAWILGRAGCATVHDHPGIISNSWLAVRFPAKPLPDDFIGFYYEQPYIGRFDLGLLECLLTIPIAIVVAILFRRKIHRPKGFYIGVVCTMYGVIRFPLDFLRVGVESKVIGSDPRYGELTPAQWACFAFVMLGAYFIHRTHIEEKQAKLAGPGAEPTPSKPPSSTPQGCSGPPSAPADHAEPPPESAATPPESAATPPESAAIPPESEPAPPESEEPEQER